MAKSNLHFIAITYNKKGRILSIGKNRYDKTHPKQAYFANKAKKPQKVFLHAEIDALIKAREKVHSIKVLRILKSGQCIEIKPCSICQLALNEYGIKY